ncbi:MAG: helix-hairpin-helix domain-containing protein, partial [Bdellovibrionota bacterium]
SCNTLIEDAKRAGVRVLPVDPNASEWDCVMTPAREVRLGWCVVHGLGEARARALVEERRARKFSSVADFLARARLPFLVNERLALGDAFGGFGFSQREALWSILAYQALSAGEGPAQEQLGLFTGLDAGSSGGANREASTRFAPLSEFAKIQADFEAYGLSVRGHPMEALRRAPGSRVPRLTTSVAKQAQNRKNVRLAGMVIARQRPHTAKGTCFATLEDETGFLDLILHPKIFETYEKIIRSSQFLIVQGEVQRDVEGDGVAMSVIVRKVEELYPAPDEESSVRVHSHDFH